MSVLPGRRQTQAWRWATYLAALLFAAAATLLLVHAAAGETPGAAAAPATAAAATPTAAAPPAADAGAAAPAPPGKVFCPICGAENKAGSRFCRADGKPLPALEPGRQAARFLRDPGTFTPEEIQQVMQRVAKSVVRIRVRALGTYKYPVTWWKDEEAEYYARPKLGKIETSLDDARSAGSGFVIAEHGMIVTNAHVAAPDGLKAELTVETQDGQSFPGRLIGVDGASDLALLSIDNDSLAPLAWGDSTQVRAGQETWAIGNPLDIGISITRGTISSITGTRAGFNQVESFLHSDAHITHGNSGGPVVDVMGRVVGVTDITFSSEKGQGYAIPSLMARTVIGELQRDGTYDRGYVGVSVKYIDADTKAQYGLTRSEGMVVDYVIPGTPAEAAGIKPGDVLLGINGRATASSYLLQEAVSSVGPSTAIVLNAERGGKPAEIKVTTALRPAAPRVDPVAELEGYLRIHFDEEKKMGALYIRDPMRSRHSPGLYDGSVVKSVVPAVDWPETDLNLNWYRTRAKPFPVHSRADLARALEHAHVGGRMAAAFETDFVFAPIAAVAFDELWPFIL